MRHVTLYKYLEKVGLAIILILLSAVVYHFRETTTDSETHVKQFTRALHKQENTASRILDDFVFQYRESEGEILNDAAYVKKLNQLFERKGIILALAENQRISFWSHNHIPLEERVLPVEETGASRIENGWYYHHKYTGNDKSFFVYYLIKNDFKYQNQFLVNRFHDALPEISDIFFISDREDMGYPVRSQDETYLFSLALRSESALVKDIRVGGKCCTAARTGSIGHPGVFYLPVLFAAVCCRKEGHRSHRFSCRHHPEPDPFFLVAGPTGTVQHQTVFAGAVRHLRHIALPG